MDQPMHDPGMEARVERLEQDSREMKAALGRLEPMIISILAQMTHLATKADLEKLRGDIDMKMEQLRGEMRVGLAGKPSIGAMWTVGITLFALVVASVALGAAYLPLISRAMHGSP